MNILLAGSSGFIGRHLEAALTAEGHRVLPASRQTGFDFSRMTEIADWLPHLHQVDAVINTVGIIAQRPGQTFDDLHFRAPAALFRAASLTKVQHVVQISALGADEQAESPYHTSKRAADNVLRTLPLKWLVLRPSLVYGQGGASTAFFNRLATLPLIPLPGAGRQLIRPIHIDDVVTAVLHGLDNEITCKTIDLVGPDEFTLRAWLETIRTMAGLPAGLYLPIPFGLALAAARLLRHIFPLVQPDNLVMLQRGNTAPVAQTEMLLGRPPLHLSL